MQYFSKKKHGKEKTLIKFSSYKLNKNWQRLGRIPSENINTFLAVTPAKIKLNHMKNKTQYEYIFRKNSQITIQNHSMVFRNQDVQKLFIKSLN